MSSGLDMKLRPSEIDLEMRIFQSEASNYQIACAKFVRNIQRKIAPSLKLIQNS